MINNSFYINQNVILRAFEVLLALKKHLNIL